MYSKPRERKGGEGGLEEEMSRLVEGCLECRRLRTYEAVE